MVAALVVLFLMLVSAATATYVVVHDSGDAITIVNAPSNGVSRLTGIGPEGGMRTIWRCPHNRFCGDVIGAAWAPDGRHLALSLYEVGGMSLYVGLHIIDTKTGHDTHLSGFSDDVSGRVGTRKEFEKLTPRALRDVRKYGCLSPEQLAWSPDGSHIAYACGVTRNGWKTSEIHIMDADGSQARLLHTGTNGAAWPSWSPTGKRLVFATAAVARFHPRTDTEQPDRVVHSAIYTIGLHGGQRRLLAPGTAPVWSPDGSVIAYRSPCGRVRLANPVGEDVTPAGAPAACAGIGPRGWPEWAPDGTRLSIAARDGIYLINTDGTQPTRISNQTGYSILRPAWQPVPRV